MFPLEDCEYVTHSKWHRMSLRKTKKHTWEILDESGTKFLENVIANQHVGPIAEWSARYRILVESSDICSRKDHISKHGKVSEGKMS